LHAPTLVGGAHVSNERAHGAAAGIHAAQRRFDISGERLDGERRLGDEETDY